MYISSEIHRTCRLLTNWGLERVSCSEHNTTSLHSVKALPDHGDDGAGSHVLDQAGEEGLALEVSIVCGWAGLEFI